ncbi:hypothetical protein L2E82_31206 [Cichorium intybus]|uniref:Uncharacterized protein n=1 Tax=Cichorium intybus TaxID=13427 RepID=A0ACB9D2E0_CICIN|nr:hypothetical protein L2E82_31206 [Cichorium intybus]
MEPAAPALQTAASYAYGARMQRCAHEFLEILKYVLKEDKPDVAATFIPLIPADVLSQYLEFIPSPI